MAPNMSVSFHLKGNLKASYVPRNVMTRLPELTALIIIQIEKVISNQIPLECYNVLQHAILTRIKDNSVITADMNNSKTLYADLNVKGFGDYPLKENLLKTVHFKIPLHALEKIDKEGPTCRLIGELEVKMSPFNLVHWDMACRNHFCPFPLTPILWKKSKSNCSGIMSDSKKKENSHRNHHDIPSEEKITLGELVKNGVKRALPWRS